MDDSKTKLTLVGVVVACGFLAGCAWDNSPPPYHSVIHYDPSRAQTYVANVAPTNAPSTRDWKTNQIVGVGYGTTGPNSTAAPAPGEATGGAASTPSGVSYGAGAGTPTPASGTPGTIINPSATAPIGTSPTAAPTTGPINTSPSVTGPQLGTGLNTTPYQPSSTPSPSRGSQPSGIGVTNTGSSFILTNRLGPLTNSFTPNGLNRPTP
jgi:hypothetical protein